MAKAAAPEQSVTIKPPNLKVAAIRIRGNAPYVQNAFSNKARETMKATQEAGSTAKKGKAREAKDFHQCFLGSLHVSEDGWHGIPAAGIRAAMISACRVAGFQMTKSKLSVFVEADGFDQHSADPMVKITKGEPEYFEATVRLETGVCDIRARGKWRQGWEAVVRVRFDADMFTLDDVVNLLSRAGQQVGIGEGRPDSRKSAGCGWGTFEVVN